mmetsp:Transcript_2160/g.4939  ORF Transcript_2160/g.4939 Transcript_2160/m.4939 type:complete len:367 (+) Transcript_2160:1343-2443(+)
MHLVGEEVEGERAGEHADDQALLRRPAHLVRHAGQARGHRGRRANLDHRRLVQHPLPLDGHVSDAPEVCHVVLEDPPADGREPREHREGELLRVAEKWPPHEREGEAHGGRQREEGLDFGAGPGAVQGPAQQVREEGERVVQAHVLVIEREHVAGATQEPPAAADEGRGGEREPQADAVVLKVPVVDENEAGIQEDDGEGPEPRSGALARVEGVHRRGGGREHEEEVREERGQAHGALAGGRLVPPRLAERHRLRLKPRDELPVGPALVGRQRRVVEAPVPQIVRLRLHVPLLQRQVQRDFHPVPLGFVVAEFGRRVGAAVAVQPDADPQSHRRHADRRDGRPAPREPPRLPPHEALTSPDERSGR